MITKWADVKDRAKINGITYAQWYDRVVRNDWDALAAATIPVQKQVKTYTIDGITASTKEHCDRKGLNLQTVKSRMKTYGMTFPDALRYRTDTSKSRKQK